MNKEIKVIKRLDKKLCMDKACPAIMQMENGDLIVIGLDVTNEVVNLTDFQAGCGENEKIVRVPKAVIDTIFNK